MAKGGEQRQIFGLKCTICRNVNYVTTRNKINTPDKLALKKFCRHCRKNQPHKEIDKLK